MVGGSNPPAGAARVSSPSLITSSREAALLALREGWPVLLSPGIIGVTFGVLSHEAGLDPLQAIGMSLLVFAGASQFAALELLRTAAGPLAVILTVALINARHLLMSTALRTWIGDRPLALRLGLAHLLTDEAFAMGARWHQRGGRGIAYYATFGAALFGLWVAGTILGVTLGAALPDPRRLGLDFAITATFLGIVVLGIRDRRGIAVAVVAGLIAAAFRVTGLSVIAVLVAGAVAPLLALRR